MYVGISMLMKCPILASATYQKNFVRHSVHLNVRFPVFEPHVPLFKRMNDQCVLISFAPDVRRKVGTCDSSRVTN